MDAAVCEITKAASESSVICKSFVNRRYYQDRDSETYVFADQARCEGVGDPICNFIHGVECCGRDHNGIRERENIRVIRVLVNAANGISGQLLEFL
ncbi:MAG: hypothetical protein JWN03_7380 [Nocardia sp.]|nr:hypothetical protein [Nocardia sp.]